MSEAVRETVRFAEKGGGSAAATRSGRPSRSAEALAFCGEGPHVDGDRLIDGLVGGDVRVFAFELAIEPAGEIAESLDDRGFGVAGHGLPEGTVPFDLDRHGVLVAVASVLADAGLQLVDVPPLNVLQDVGDPMQFLVPGGMGADGPDRASGVAP